MKRTLIKTRYILLSISILSFLGAIFFLSTIIFGRSISNVGLQALLGNTEENIARISEDGKGDLPFTFLIVGDPELKRHFEHFLKNTRFPVTPDFGIILGDLVKNPEIENHDFFKFRYSKIELDFPILLVAGNHDVATEKYSNKPNAFFVSDFKETYGAAEFNFTFRGCLFVVVNDNYNEDYLVYLRRILREKSGDAVMTFVLMHIPPPSVISVPDCRPLEGEEEFLLMMEEYGVDYVLCADYHSYHRSEFRGTNYIVSGGGGSKLYEGEEKSFYHAITVKVDPKTGRVDEKIYPINKARIFLHDFEKMMSTEVYPFFRYNPTLGAIILSLIGFVFILSLLGYLWITKKYLRR